MERVFSRGLALGEGFCNREEETRILAQNIRNLTHTLISSPRRYGKTSLALHVIHKEKILYAHMDLFMKYKREEIFKEFYEAISKIISEVIKPTEKTIKKVAEFLKNIKVSLTFGKAGLAFALAAENEKKSLRFLLEGLDNLLAKSNKKIVLFVDEMQTLSESDAADEVESAIRFVAQKTKNIVFIFSGSNRRLLADIFEDKRRPFYKLCQKMIIHKIAAEHYRKHLNKFAKIKWNKELSLEVIEEFNRVTLCHPYYVNILADKLFQEKKIPDEESVKKNWYQCCVEEQGAIGRDLEFLTTKQKQLLAAVARTHHLTEPTAKAFVERVNLTPKGVNDALQILYRYDMIEKDVNGVINVIDPVLVFWADGKS